MACGGFEQGFQAGQKVWAWPAGGAEALEVGGFLLAVNEGEAEGVEGLHKKDESQLRGIGVLAKHAFAEKHIAEAEAIEAAHQFFFEEGLHAVCEAQVVQLYIGVLHFSRQPGALLSGPGGGGAGINNLLKAAVDPKVEGVAVELFLKAFGNVEGVGLQHKARVRAMPQNGGALVIPGENALAIGRQQAPGAQIPPHGENAVGGGPLRRGKLKRVRTQTAIGEEVAWTQIAICPVKARTLFLVSPKVWR